MGILLVPFCGMNPKLFKVLTVLHPLSKLITYISVRECFEAQYTHFSF